MIEGYNPYLRDKNFDLVWDNTPSGNPQNDPQKSIIGAQNKKLIFLLSVHI